MRDEWKSLCKQQGKNPAKVEEQLSKLSGNAPFFEVDRPATPGDGIRKLTERECEGLREYFGQTFKPEETVFFIPASGAATRMFKEIVSLLPLSISERQDNAAYQKLVDNRELLPFAIPPNLQNEHLPEYLIETKEYHTFPKGLLPFHQYNNETLSATEEHLNSLINLKGELKLELSLNAHFTVSPSFQDRFEMVAQGNKYSHVVKTRYSFQHSDTDTPAATLEGEPFVVNGSWLFRPGGHGALLRNLNELEHPLVVIRNIDNIPRKEHQAELDYWRHVLMGYLQQTVQKVHKGAEKIKSGSGAQVKEDLNALFSLDNTENWSDSDWLNFLNRPIRVCGMVKNEGEPGGGPFWANNCFGETSLQIVEKAQLDLSKDSVK